MENKEEINALAAAAANGQKLRVAVTKTSAQGQAAQADSPNLMSFSSDENSVWFNGKKYGALHLKGVEKLSASSTSAEIAAVIGEATEANFLAITNFIGRAGVVIAQDEWKEYVASCNYNNNAGSSRYILVEYLKYSDKLVKRSLNFKFSGTAWSLAVTAKEVTDPNTDKFQSSLGDTVQMPAGVGGIKAGTTVAQLNGKKQNEIIDMLLFPEQQPTVANPSASISLKNAFKANGIYEVGAAGPAQTDFTTGFNRGACTVAGQPSKNRAGALDSSKSFIYVGGGESNKTLPEKVTLGTMQYNFKAYYGQGDTLLTSWGNNASVTPNPMPAGGLSSGAIYIYGTYPYYCNGASASSSAQDTKLPGAAAPGTKLPLQKWTDTLVGAKFASEAATGTRFEFKFPATKQVTKVELMNTVSGKWDLFNANGYKVEDAGEMQINGTGVAYKTWTTQGSLNGAMQLRFTLGNASARMMAEDGLDDDMIEAVLKAPSGESVEGGIQTLAEDVAGEDGIMVAAVDTGNREAGGSEYGGNFEPTGQKPFDARLLVPTKADLVNAKTYAAKNYYKGMMVVVQDTQDVYVLKDVSKVSSSDYSGWKRIDAGAATKTAVVDNLDSTSTTSALSANQGQVLKGLVDGKLSKSDVVNNLTTNDAAKALSAAQGKALSDKISALGSVYRIKGTKANISEVLALTDAKVGDTWNVTSEFTLQGQKYPAGTNVVCVTATSASSHDDRNWDALGGTVDLSPYQTKTEASETYATKTELTAHSGNKSNPHGVTKAQLGLSNVTNDAQVRKADVADTKSTDAAKVYNAPYVNTELDKKLSKTEATGTYATKASLESTNQAISGVQGTLNEHGKKMLGYDNHIAAATTNHYVTLPLVKDTVDTSDNGKIASLIGKPSEIRSAIENKHMLYGRVSDASGDVHGLVSVSAMENGHNCVILDYAIVGDSNGNGFWLVELTANWADDETWSSMSAQVYKIDGIASLANAAKSTADAAKSTADTAVSGLTSKLDKTVAESTYAKKADLGIVIE